MVDFSRDVKACVQILKEHGVILYPTDTVWGIGCDATHAGAVEKVFALKHRPPQKSLIILLADARDILKHVAAPPPDIISWVEKFERPTTLIFQGAIGFAENAIGEDGSVAIRIPNDPFCKALLKRFGKPLISTSANINGEPTAQIFTDINPVITAGCDYVVHYRRDDINKTAPSRILKILDDGEVTVVRE